MKLLKIFSVIVLSLAAMNVSASPYQYHHQMRGYHNGGYHNGYNGHHGNEYHHGYRNYYHRGYGHGYSRFGYTPWVIGGAFLFGSIILNQNQTVYIDHGTSYHRVDRYCTDQYGQNYICGYDWIQD